MNDEYLHLKFEIEKKNRLLNEIKEICGNINLTIAGGDASPKQDWIDLYLHTTGTILNKIREQECQLHQ